MRRRNTLETIAGRVAGDGTILAGEGFTVQRTSAGVYTLTFRQGFKLVAINVNGGAGGFIYGNTLNYSERTVVVGMTNATANVDTTWVFIAAGVQQ